MAICMLCNKETGKMIDCTDILNGKICFPCCFAVSSGRPDIIRKLRTNFNKDKETILKICSECQKKLPK